MIKSEDSAAELKSGTVKPMSDVAVQLQPQDQIALARDQHPAGLVVRLAATDGSKARITLQDPVPAGHKVALRDIAEGEQVLRYGHIIGVATQNILAGQHVHSQNLRNPTLPRELARGARMLPIPPVPEAERQTFQGYLRANGKVGTRNTIAILCTVDCAAPAGVRIARYFSPERLFDFPNVDDVFALTHHSGCSIRRDGPDYVWLQRSLAGIARNPNVAGYILVGLGCEVNQIDDLIANHDLTQGGGQPVVRLTIQELGGVTRTIRAGIAAVEEMLPLANEVARTPQPISELTVALQCGGSDAWSGVTANPIVGLVSDEIVRQGGTVVLGETPEIYGAEHLLTNRAVSTQVAEAVMDKVLWWEALARRQGTELDNNPTPGNKAGGLTTIYEKALGAVAKSGNTPLMAVYEYAQPVLSRGVTFMNTPGNDPVSITGQVAGGCNLILFTTGRGSVLGFKPAPAIKIVSNSPTYHRLRDDMDFDAGSVLKGVSLKSGRRLAGPGA